MVGSRDAMPLKRFLTPNHAETKKKKIDIRFNVLPEPRKWVVYMNVLLGLAFRRMRFWIGV